MADISRYLFLRHLRGEQSSHLLHFRNGEIVRSGRGLSFWFLPMSASIAEVPIDDREQTFLFHGRTRDFQDVTLQGVLAYRVVDPDVLAQRVDFTIDLATGAYRKTPLQTLAQQLSQLAQQLADGVVAPRTVRELLADGLEAARDRIEQGLTNCKELSGVGLQLVSVRINDIKPTADLEKALQMPTRELIQQAADQATFSRRAVAVQNERAIAENELTNRIELARQEELLIQQTTANQRREVEEAQITALVASRGASERAAIEADTAAARIRVVESARVEATRAEIEVYRDLPSTVMLGLAAKEFASKLRDIEHLSITPELLGPLLTRYLGAHPQAS